MRALWLAAAGAFVAMSATGEQASAQAVSRCSQFGSSITCRTTADPMAQMQQQQQQNMQQLDNMMAQQQARRAAAAAQHYAWQDVPPTKCTKLEKFASESDAYCAAREVAANRKAVGDLVAQGKCQDALAAALGTGDFDFARDVRAFCEGK